MNQKITNMVHFIGAETEKTIAQLRKAAEQTALVSYDQIINADTTKVRTKVQGMHLAEEHKRQVEISRLISKARMTVQEAQDKQFKALKSRCVQDLTAFTQDRAKYGQFMKAVLAEAVSCCSMTRGIVQMHARDADMLSVLSGACSGTCSLTLDKQQLPDSAIGGFILVSEDGRVRVDCTLAERLEQSLKCMEPTVLKAMFPASTGLWEN